MTPTVKFALFEQTLFSCDLTLKLGDGARGGTPYNVLWKMAQKGWQMNFMALKSRDNVLFLWMIPI